MKSSLIYICLFSAILLGQTYVNGQSKKIDSLYAALKTEKEDTNKVNTLNILIRELYNKSNYPTADSLARNALKLAQNLNFKKGMGNAYSNIGLIYTAQGNYPEALKSQLQSLKVVEEIGYKKGMSSAYGNIGNIYEAQGNYPEALKNYLQYLKIVEDLGYKGGMANGYYNVGVIYFYQGNYPEALKNQLQSLKIYGDIGYKQGMGIAYGGIGNIYETQGNYPEALKNQLQSLKIDKEIGNKQGIGYAYGNIGDIYFHQGNYPEALKNLLQTLKIAKEIGDKQVMGNAYGNIGNVFIKQKKYDEAKKYLDSALTLSKSIGNKETIRDSYNYWAELDSATGNYKVAYQDYKNFIIYRDSLMNEENTKKLVQSQMQYDFDKKQDEEKAEQDKKDAIAAADKRKQQILTASIGLGLLLVLVFAGFVFRSLRVTRKQKALIERQKAVVEEQKIVVEHQKALVEEKNKEVLDSITYAKRLQDAILPPLSVIKKYLPESFVLYKPKDIVAGDFYWMERSGDNILIAACDCTGHGVPGALVSVVCSNALNRALNEFKIRDTGKMLDKVRELVLETFVKSEGKVKDGMDASFCAINTTTNVVEWSGAYNPLWYIQQGEMKEIIADKQPIGQADNPKPFSTHTLNLQKGDILYLFTDGYADQFGGPKGKKFKYKQFQELLLANAPKPMEEQGKLLDETIEAWKGSLEQVDDVLVIGIRV